MRLEYSRFVNIGPFDDWTLDLRGLGDALLVALVGANGAGKTSALEMAVFGAVARKMPTEGTLVNRARARHSLLESRLVTPAGLVTIRHNVDAIGRKGESVVLDANREPLYKGTGVKTFEAWASRNLPDEDVIRSTIFSVQKAEGFIELGSSERISVLLRIIGVERIERAAKRARELANGLRVEIEALAARIADTRGGTVSVPEATAELQTAQEAASTHAAALAAAQERLSDLEIEAHQAGWLAAEVQMIAERNAALKAKHEAALARLESLSDRLAAASAMVRRGPEIRAAEGRAAELRELVAAEEQDIHDRNARTEAARLRREELRASLSLVQARLADAEERIANNRQILAQSDQIRAAAEAVAAAEREALELQARDKFDEGELARLGSELSANVSAFDEVAVRLKALRADLEGAADVERAAASYGAAAEAVHEAEDRLAQIEKRLATAQAAGMEAVASRVVWLRGGLSTVVSLSQSAAVPAAIEDLARRVLLTDDQAAADASGGPALIAEIEREIASAHGAVRLTTANFNSAQVASAKMAGIRAKREEVDRLDAEQGARLLTKFQLEASFKRVSVAREAALSRRMELYRTIADHQPHARLKTALDGAAERVAERELQAASAREEKDVLEAQIASLPAPGDAIDPLTHPPLVVLRAELARVGPIALRAAELAQAEGTEAALRPEHEAALVAEREARAALDAAEPVPEVPKVPDIGPAKTEVESLQAEESRLAAAVARAAARLEQAEAADARAAALEAELSAKHVEHSDWTRLALDLGRDGVQSAEVDSAGPELTEIVNDLLHSCHGPRFTVSIDTTRLSSDGKDQIDECRVQVIDTVKGREGEAREFSGGERVILSEAVSLALTTLACRRAGIQRPTLFRDESGAALDQENSRVYVAMLRRAALAIGADRVLLVSHSKEVQAMCDARIEVGAPSRVAEAAE